jgi:hypothetical protein
MDCLTKIKFLIFIIFGIFLIPNVNATETVAFDEKLNPATGTDYSIKISGNGQKGSSQSTILKSCPCIKRILIPPGT